jgi:hypothetical protein
VIYSARYVVLVICYLTTLFDYIDYIAKVPQRGSRTVCGSLTSLARLARDIFNNIMFDFKNRIFDLISLHKYKLFFPLCLKYSIFVFVFNFCRQHGATQKTLAERLT